VIATASSTGSLCNRKLGIFGAPTFAIGSEIYWGDDRLADALSFASGR
jgi:2-hydroxychromene-2-carboxylate isomerase